MRFTNSVNHNQFITMSVIIKTPNEKMLEKLIMEEAELRASQLYRDRCTAVKDIPNGWLTITDQFQQEIARNNGFDDEISCHITCNMMRRAHLLYPDNITFKTIPIQVKNNKAKQGVLKIGDTVSQKIKTMHLFDLEGARLTLSDLLKPYTIIFAGSQT